jgi:hypothetical protein
MDSRDIAELVFNRIEGKRAAANHTFRADERTAAVANHAKEKQRVNRQTQFPM